MITQDLIEVQKDSTYTFTHFIENQNTSIVPTTATISIFSSDGTEILTATDMTINATTGVCTYAWDSTGQDVGRDYIIKYQLDSYDIVVRIFDIMLYPFINNVTDDDLITEYKDLESELFSQSGVAQSGTTTTLIDTNRIENDDYWNGGIIEVYYEHQKYTREIIDFNSTTNTITFDDLPFAITTEDYMLRRSFQKDINHAGNNVQLYFKSLSKRAYLVIDSYTLKRLVIFEFFKKYFFQLIKSDDDEFSIKYNHYVKMYDVERQSLKLVYDDNEDGNVDESETDSTTMTMQWYR